MNQNIKGEERTEKARAKAERKNDKETEVKMIELIPVLSGGQN